MAGFPLSREWQKEGWITPGKNLGAIDDYNSVLSIRSMSDIMSGLPKIPSGWRSPA